MPEIEAAVYDSITPSTLIDTLDSARERGWLDQLNDVGSGSLKVHAADDVLVSNPTILNYGNIVRYTLNGVDRFAFIIETRNLPPASPSEEGGRWWTVAGRGVLALLEDAIVYTESTVEGSFQRQRQFNWTAIAYDDSTWIAATQIARQDAGHATYGGWPLEWPDPLAYWIWSDVFASYSAGSSFFRRDFTLASDTILRIYATCDNAIRLYLDGDEVVTDWPGDNVGGWTETKQSQDIRLPAGTHQIAVEGVNYLTAGGNTSPAALLVTVINAETQAVILRSDSNWVCLHFPASVPGMTIGQILTILLDEAQARGSLSGVTWTFDSALDSHGAFWTEDEVDIALDIGTNYLDVMRTLIEQHVDVEMSPTLELAVYNRGTLGSDLTGTVDLVVGTDFEEADTQGEDHRANSVLARDTTGRLTEVDEATSLSERKRKEAYLELALAPTTTRAQAMSNEILTELAYPTGAITGRVAADAGPYTDWTRGDMIHMPNAAGTPTDTNILSLAVSEDEAGHPIYHFEGMQDDAST